MYQTPWAWCLLGCQSQTNATEIEFSPALVTRINPITTQIPHQNICMQRTGCRATHFSVLGQYLSIWSDDTAGVEHLPRRLLWYRSTYNGDLSSSSDLWQHRDRRWYSAVYVFGVAGQDLQWVGAAPYFLKQRHNAEQQCQKKQCL